MTTTARWWHRPRRATAQPAALMAVFALAAVHAGAQTDLGASRAAEEAVGGITGIAEMIIADSFSPVTGFDESDTHVVLSPALFTIEQVHESPRVDAQDLSGWSVGAGGGYALSDRLLVYGIAAGMGMRGGIALDPYEGLDETLEADIRYSIVSVLGGVGYELYDSRVLSVPVFGGPQLLYYSGRVDPETIESSGYRIEASISGRGLIPAVSGGVAAAIEVLQTVKVTPYVIGLLSLSGASLDAEITATPTGAGLTPPAVDESVESPPIAAAMFGLDVGYHSATGWSVSLALGDLIAYLTGVGNTVSSEGIEMRPLILIATYRR